MTIIADVLEIEIARCKDVRDGTTGVSELPQSLF